MKRVKVKKTRAREVGVDEVLPEYEFSRARPNKYASRYAKGSIVVTLDPDVAAVFPGAREANEALRALAVETTVHGDRRDGARNIAVERTRFARRSPRRSALSIPQ